MQQENIVRDFYCSLVTTQIAKGGKEDTAINREQGDDKKIAIYLAFLLMLFSIITTLHATQTWITSTFNNCTATKSLH